MYHRYSAGSISYAEFRHLGKEGMLGKYSIHFHLVGDTMRGSSVIGASIWDSANRWITIHGTNTWSSATASATRASATASSSKTAPRSTTSSTATWPSRPRMGKPLPSQVLPFDRNDGAGFWWANSHNAFTRNVAVECDHYGYRFDAPELPGFDLVMPVRGPRRPAAEGGYPDVAVPAVRRATRPMISAVMG